MEHFKSRNNDFFHFTNPHDDRSELDDDDYDELQSYDVDDDRSCDFNFYSFQMIDQSPSPGFQTSGMKNQNEALTSSKDERGAFDNGNLILEIEHTMKNLSDKLQYTIEGIGAQISRLYGETCKLDKHVEDVKNSAERYNEITHRKLRQMKGILQEVQDGVVFLRDKHEIAETHLQLAMLEGSKRNQIKSAQTSLHHQLPSPASQSSCYSPITTPLYQLPPNETAFSPSVSYGPPGSWAPETAIQHYPSQPARWVSSQEHEPGPSLLTGVLSSRNYKSEFHTKYMPKPTSFPDIHPHQESPFSHEISNVNPKKFSYPVPKELPHALPTASNEEYGSTSNDTRNRTPVDDIVDKVTAMGFRRDLVKASVRKLTENGSPLDLNVVLDKMMNNT